MSEILRRFWPHIAAGLAIVGLTIALLLTRATLAEKKTDLANLQNAFDQQIADYRAAAAKARADDLANAQRVKTEQQQITERNERAHEAQMADANARYERLRAKAAAYSGTAGTTDVSASRDATCLAYAGTGCEAIPALLLEAQRNTDQLVALQSWVSAQSAIDVNGATQ